MSLTKEAQEYVRVFGKELPGFAEIVYQLSSENDKLISALEKILNTSIIDLGAAQEIQEIARIVLKEVNNETKNL